MWLRCIVELGRQTLHWPSLTFSIPLENNKRVIRHRNAIDLHSENIRTTINYDTCSKSLHMFCEIRSHQFDVVLILVVGFVRSILVSIKLAKWRKHDTDKLIQFSTNAWLKKNMLARYSTTSEHLNLGSRKNNPSIQLSCVSSTGFFPSIFCCMFIVFVYIVVVVVVAAVHLGCRWEANK